MADWLVLPAEGAAYTYDRNDQETTLIQLQRLVGGYVEVLQIQVAEDHLDMWVNEEGAYSGNPVNRNATALARAFAPHALLMPEGIRGGAVLTRVDDMGETRPLTTTDIELVTAMLANLGVTP